MNFNDAAHHVGKIFPYFYYNYQPKNMQNIQYPIKFSFRITTLSNDFKAIDATGATIAYVRQKMFKLKEAITVYSDTSKTQVLFTIKANKWLDWSAAYAMFDANGTEIGKIARKGWKSIWKAEYDIIDQNGKQQYKVKEASAWTRVADSLIGEIPVIGSFTGYMFHPTYNVTDVNGDIVAKLKKKASFFGKEFEVEKITENTEPIIWGMDSPAITFEDQDDSFMQLRDDMDFDVIVLDAGHGGKDPGSMNRSMGLREKDIALSITLKVGEYIEQNLPDVDVVYTRTEDEFIPLEERGLMANRAGGDLFVSIHANSVNTPNASGSEIFFLGLERSESALDVMKRENSVLELENGNGTLELSEEELLIYELANSGNIAVSERIAAMVENQFRARAQRRSRGVKQARLVVLWHASMPAILVELGFLSNPQEARYMNSDYGQSILASAIFRAIRDFKLEYDKSMRQPVQNSASNE
jgi:N-acetylmuramoyl-L-alanine amidase